MRLTLLALLLAGCVPLGRDEHLTALAREEWTRVGVPERFADSTPIHAQRCVGLPGYIGAGGELDMYVPWPWSEWDAAARIIMRYELAKAAWQLHGAGRWYAPVVFADGLLHLPPSELHSWWRAVSPADVPQ